VVQPRLVRAAGAGGRAPRSVPSPRPRPSGESTPRTTPARLCPADPGPLTALDQLTGHQVGGYLAPVGRGPRQGPTEPSESTRRSGPNRIHAPLTGFFTTSMRCDQCDEKQAELIEGERAVHPMPVAVPLDLGRLEVAGESGTSGWCVWWGQGRPGNLHAATSAAVGIPDSHSRRCCAPRARPSCSGTNRPPAMLRGRLAAPGEPVRHRLIVDHVQARCGTQRPRLGRESASPAAAALP
jgi:hypothetical protein